MSKIRFPEFLTSFTPVIGMNRPPGPVRVTSAAVKVDREMARSKVTRTAETVLADGRVGVAAVIRRAGGAGGGMVNVVLYAVILTPCGSVTLGPRLKL